jgi:hypothetical protein
MRTFTSVAATLSLALASTVASAWFFIIPIPSPAYDPDKIEASKEQRQLAMCAAFHREVVDPNLSGSRKTSWRSKVEDAVVAELKGFDAREKLITAYAKQWGMQTKSSSERGQSWGKMLQIGCDNAGFPVEEKEFAEWSAQRATVAEVRKEATSQTGGASQVQQSQNVSSGDTITDQALARCRAIGFKDGTADFRNCAMEQIRLISGGK